MSDIARRQTATTAVADRDQDQAAERRPAMTLVVMVQDEAGGWTEVKRTETDGESYVPVTAHWPPCDCPSPTCPYRARERHSGTPDPR